MSRPNQNAMAAVFRAPGQPLELRAFDMPQVSPGEGLVKVDCCTLCGSDLHSIHGKRNIETPVILGHEIIGRLVEVTTGLCDVNGVPLGKGDRVTWSIAASCQNCFFCKHGIPQKCEHLFKYGHQTTVGPHPLSGGLATHCHLARRTAIVKLPDELTDYVASPANCATATVAGAMRIGGHCNGKSVVIIGAGMLGLTATAMARHQGAEHVFVCDTHPARAKLALKFGATHLGLTELADVTKGRGADLIVDLSGSPDAMEAAVQHVRIGGRLILVGAVFPERPLSIQAEQVVRRMLRIEGLHNYTPGDLSTAIEFLQETHEQFPFHQLVDREYRLNEINQAIEAAHNNQFIRVAIRPNES